MIFRTNCEDDGSLFNDEVNFGASIRQNFGGRYRKEPLKNMKVRRNSFNSRFINRNRINDPTQIATIIQNPDFEVNSNEISQVNEASLFDQELFSPDYDNTQQLQLTPDWKSSRIASKKYKSINLSGRRNLENSYGGYSQVSVANNKNTTFIHGQDAEGKNTQIIINLTHQPKSYLYGSKPVENESTVDKEEGLSVYKRPRPVGPPNPGPTQPTPPVATVSPPSPVGPPSPPARPSQFGQPALPSEISPPSISNSIFRNDVLRNQNRYNRYETNANNQNRDFNSFQNYQDSNTVRNTPSGTRSKQRRLAQPRSISTLNAQNNAFSTPTNNYLDGQNNNPVSSSTFSFSSQNDNSNYLPPPQSAPPSYGRPSASLDTNTNYLPQPQSDPSNYGRPVAIPPTKTYFLPAAPPSRPALPLSTYHPREPSEQLDQVQPPAPPRPPPSPPTIIDAYNAPEQAAPQRPSYIKPQQNPPSSNYGVPQAEVANSQQRPTYGAPQENPPQAPSPPIQYHPAKISFSIMAQPVAIQQQNAATLSPNKPSYQPQQQPPTEQNQNIQLNPATFDIVQNPQNGNAVHYHVHVDDVEDLQAFDQMFSENAPNDEGPTYGAPPQLNPTTIYGAPLADPPAPPPKPQYQAEPLQNPTNSYSAPQAAPPAPPPRLQYGPPMQLTPSLRPLMAPRPPPRPQMPMYGRPRNPNLQSNPLSSLANAVGGLASIKLNSQKQNFVVGENSKLKELLGLKCFIWCKFDQLEFSNRRSDPGSSSPANQLLSPQAQMPARIQRRPRARLSRNRG